MKGTSVEYIKQAHGAASKVVVLGMLKPHGNVFMVVVQNTKTNILIIEIARKIKPNSLSIQMLITATMHWMRANFITI